MLHCLYVLFVFFFKQKTAYEMRISDWSSDVCSSDLIRPARCISDETKISDARDEGLWLVVVPIARLTISDQFCCGTSSSSPCDQIGRASCRERVCQYV